MIERLRLRCLEWLVPQVGRIWGSGSEQPGRRAESIGGFISGIDVEMIGPSVRAPQLWLLALQTIKLPSVYEGRGHVFPLDLVLRCRESERMRVKSNGMRFPYSRPLHAREMAVVQSKQPVAASF